MFNKGYLWYHHKYPAPLWPMPVCICRTLGTGQKLLGGIELLDSLVKLNLSGSRGVLTPRLKLASIELEHRNQKFNAEALKNILNSFLQA